MADDFTPGQLEQFERSARERAQREARLLYPPSEIWLIRDAVNRLTLKYFREYTGVTQ